MLLAGKGRSTFTAETLQPLKIEARDGAAEVLTAAPTALAAHLKGITLKGDVQRLDHHALGADLDLACVQQLEA